MHRCLWLVLLVLAFLPARASDFELDVSSYFGEPVPATVPGMYAEIQNNTARTVRGRVEAVSGEQVIAWAELELPPHARRRTELRVTAQPPATGDLLAIKLLVDGKLAARDTLSSDWFNSPVLVLSPKLSLVGLYKAYEAHHNIGGSTRAVVTAPESGRAYQGARLIIVHDAAGLALNEAQMLALASFVREGGEVLFIANQDPAEYRGTPLEGIFPLTPSGIKTLAAGYTVVTGTVPSGDKVVVKREGAPLLISGSRGLGRVYLITAEALTPSLLGEKTTFSLFDRLAMAERQDSRWQPQDLWGISHEDRLKFSTIALGLGLYFLAAGPLNFFFLRDRHRRVWVLLTLPLLSLTFSGLVLLYSSYARGFEPRLTQFGLLRLESGERLGLYEATIFLDSLWEGKFTLECGPEADLTSDDSYFIDPSAPRVTPFGLSDGRAELRDLALNAWSGTSLRLTQTLLLQGPIHLELQPVNGRMLGTLDNASGWTLEGCQIYHQGQRTSVFSLPPGQLAVDMPLGGAALTGNAVRDTMRSSVGLDPQSVYLTGFLPSSPDSLSTPGVQRRIDLTLVAVKGR